MNSPPPFTLRIRTEQDQDIDWMVQPDEITFHQALEVISRIQPDTTVTAFQYVDEDGERITVRSDDELKAMFEMYICDLSEDDIERGLLPPLVIYPRVGKTPQDRNIHHLKGIYSVKLHTPAPLSNKTDTFKTNTGIKTANQGPKLPQPQPAKQSQASQHGNQSVARHQNPQTQQFGSQPHGAAPQNTHGSTRQQQLGAGTQNPHGSMPGAETQAENIRKILTCGSIVASDLQQIDLLGTGNGGHVYKAFHTPTQRLMAVKIIELDVNYEVQRKILSELEILYKCESPNIIGFYGAFFIENRISICTEFMDGGSLDKYGQVPEQVLGRIAVGIVQGLLYMWSLKILHRDVKPSNILVNTHGEVKLCDFGVSTQLVESIAQTYVGTNAYMSPERIKAEDYGAPSEVWSLGVTIFELAAGGFPFKEIARQANPMQLCKAILEENPPVLPGEHFSAELVDFVARCMQKVPGERITHTEILMHPYIQMYRDNGVSVISAWVTQQLTEHLRKLQTDPS